MARGRPRKHNPSIPTHVDQARIPPGIYWDASGAGRWFVIEQATAAHERPRRRTVAGPQARLSDLHAIAERQAGVDKKSLRAMLAAYHDSSEFKTLAKETRVDYEYCRDRVVGYRTRAGGEVGDLEAKRIPRPLVQLLVDEIAKGRKRNSAGQLIPTPSAAVHVLRYLRVAFRWGGTRGLASEVNPADGVYAPKERKRRRLPTHQVFAAVLEYARAQAGPRGKAGAVPPYLADVAEIAWLCRLRGVEVVVDLNDADILPEGLRCRRRKGSLTNVTQWDPELRAVIDRRITWRNAYWQKHRMPVPLQPDARPIVVGTSGQPLTRRACSNAWQRMITAAIAAGVIPEGERFSLHDLKRRGVTDTAGTRGEKQQASGHRQEAMMDIYDQEVPLVESAAASLRKKPKAT